MLGSDRSHWAYADPHGTSRVCASIDLHGSLFRQREGNHTLTELKDKSKWRVYITSRETVRKMGAHQGNFHNTTNRRKRKRSCMRHHSNYLGLQTQMPPLLRFMGRTPKSVSGHASLKCLTRALLEWSLCIFAQCTMASTSPVVFSAAYLRCC